MKYILIALKYAWTMANVSRKPEHEKLEDLKNELTNIVNLIDVKLEVE